MQSEMLQYKFQTTQLQKHNEVLKENVDAITRDCNAYKTKASQEKEVLQAQLNNQSSELKTRIWP